MGLKIDSFYKMRQKEQEKKKIRKYRLYRKNYKDNLTSIFLMRKKNDRKTKVYNLQNSYASNKLTFPVIFIMSNNL